MRLSDRTVDRSGSHLRESARRSASVAADLAELSGLAATPDTTWVVVPTSLLGHASPARALSDDLFNGDGTVEAALQITEAEKIALQAEWRNVRTRIHELESSRATSQEMADGSVHIELPEMDTQLSAIGWDFKRAVADHLGDNRASTFLAMKRVPTLFESQPRESALNVSVESTGDGQWRYRTESVTGDGNRQVWVGESIPLAIRHLTDAAHIPPTLGGQAPRGE